MNEAAIIAAQLSLTQKKAVLWIPADGAFRFADSDSPGTLRTFSLWWQVLEL